MELGVPAPRSSGASDPYNKEADQSNMRCWPQHRWAQAAAQPLQRQQQRRRPWEQRVGLTLVLACVAGSMWPQLWQPQEGSAQPSEQPGSSLAAPILGFAAPHRKPTPSVGKPSVWPSARPMRKFSKGSGKRSKQSCVKYLQDRRYPKKTKLWAVGIMRKFKYFTGTWEYVLAMKALSELGYSKFATALWKEMTSRGIEPNAAAYTSAIVAYNQDQKHKKASRLVDKMELENLCPLKIGCENAMMAYEELGESEKALKLLDRMWEFTIPPDEMTYMPAIRACENAGDFEQGAKLFKTMRHQTKLAKAQEETKLDFNPQPPKADNAIWRIPGDTDPRYVKAHWQKQDEQLERLLAVGGEDDEGKQDEQGEQEKPKRSRYLEPPGWKPTKL